MAVIQSIEVNTDGSIKIKDTHREHPVTICSEGAGYLIQYLKMVKKQESRNRLMESLPRIKSNESRYLMKLAIDSYEDADDWIKHIQKWHGKGKGWHGDNKRHQEVARVTARATEFTNTLRTPTEPNWRQYLEEQKLVSAKLNFSDKVVDPNIELLDIDYVLTHAIINYSPEEYPTEQPYIDNRLIPHMRTTKLPLPVIEIYNRQLSNQRPDRPKNTNIHVIDGNHRIVAMKKLGFKKIPFIVYRESIIL